VPAVQALLERTRAGMLISTAIALVRRGLMSSVPATPSHSAFPACD
jgi:hypothetical protein